jgi:hypothetical protein
MSLLSRGSPQETCLAVRTNDTGRTKFETVCLDRLSELPIQSPKRECTCLLKSNALIRSNQWKIRPRIIAILLRGKGILVGT